MRDILARLILAYAIASGAALEVAAVALLFWFFTRK
jgi:hypothetical protein